MYDRISERRLALEAAAREAEQQASLLAATPEPEPVPVVPLQNTPSSFSFGGFNLALPDGFQFRDIQTTIDYEGELVALTIKRRDIREGRTLEQMLSEALQTFLKLYPELRVIRESDCLVAGSAGRVLDFNFSIGHTERHGRLVGSIVPVAGRSEPQWLSISCVIDPAKPRLSLWLADFDNMLAGMTAR
jgi:hypothetical protein